jgi:hypothetical protein
MHHRCSHIAFPYFLKAQRTAENHRVIGTYSATGSDDGIIILLHPEREFPTPTQLDRNNHRCHCHGMLTSLAQKRPA